jgi:hypothetical protein
VLSLIKDFLREGDASGSRQFVPDAELEEPDYDIGIK